jgi:hypothetical protein
MNWSQTELRGKKRRGKEGGGESYTTNIKMENGGNMMKCMQMKLNICEEV